MRKYDCFTFLNGFDMLKLRFETLADHVDRFVLVEQTHDFQGNPKPLYWKENPISGYRVKHVVVEPRWTGRVMMNRPELAWNNTNGAVEEGFRIGCEDADATDLGYFSDFDEIVRPSKLLAGPLDDPVLFELQLFVYWLNCATGQRWPMVTRIPFGRVTSYWSALMYRYAADKDKVIIPDAGWHFTSFGGIDLVEEKFRGYPDNPLLTLLPRDKIEESILGARDFSDAGQGFKQWGIGPLPDDLPQVILRDPQAWREFIHPDWRDRC